MEEEWNHEYDPLADIDSITAMYADPIFTGWSVMYDKEAECASMMMEGLLTNQFKELYNDASWNGVLNGEDQDKDFASNVGLFVAKCHVLHVDSLFRTSIGCMSGKSSHSRKDVCPLFTTDPDVIDLGRNLMIISLPP